MNFTLRNIFCCFKRMDGERLPADSPPRARLIKVHESVDCNANPKDVPRPHRRAADCNPEDLAQIRRAILNAQNKQGQTPLHLAVLQCSAEMTSLLLECEVDVNIHDRSGNTALHLAAFSEHKDCTSSECQDREEIVKSLLRRGSDVDARNGNLETPLMMAVRGWSLDIVKLLLTAGANVHSRNRKGQTCLHLLLASPGKTDVMVELMKAGATVESCDENGRTPLWYILHREGPKQENLKEAKEFIKTATLLSNGRKINFSVSQELGCYADECHEEVVLMKSLSFGTECNLLDFVVKGIDATSIKHEAKVMVMKSIFQAVIKGSFHVYTYCVEVLFHRSYLCGKVMKMRIYTKNNFGGTVFPDHLSPELCKFLSVKDLLNLLRVSYDCPPPRIEK